MNQEADAIKTEALAWAQKGRNRKSRDLLEAGHQSFPERLDLAYRLSLARLEDAEVDSAVELLEAALEKDPERELFASDWLAPVDDLLTRRPTFHNLKKLKKRILEGKPLKLKGREIRAPHAG